MVFNGLKSYALLIKWRPFWIFLVAILNFYQNLSCESYDISCSWFGMPKNVEKGYNFGYGFQLVGKLCPFKYNGGHFEFSWQPSWIFLKTKAVRGVTSLAADLECPKTYKWRIILAMVFNWLNSYALFNKWRPFWIFLAAILNFYQN